MKLIVISTNAGLAMGGEALKALQYVQELFAQGHDVELITHARCREGLVGLLPEGRVRYVEDSAAMQTCWRVPGLRRLINGLFHREVARMIRGYDRDDVVVQYLCPISPVEPRFPPKGYRCVIGPVSGNIFYPDGFRHLDGIGARLRGRAYRPVQRMLGLALRQYKQVDRVLVSGYARTKEALRWAGCPEDKMQSVWDAGLSAELITGPRMDPQAAPRDFLWIGRMEPYKGGDLAIRALAMMEEEAQLTLYGDGSERAALETLVRQHGLEARIRFAGWLSHDEVPTVMRQHRAMIFPSLREANGIIMQEAMAVGLPVLTLRWGGPMGLATDAEALFVEVDYPDQVVRDLAGGMDRLIREPDLAERLSAASRQKAVAEFAWTDVARSWYEAAMGQGPRS